MLSGIDHKHFPYEADAIRARIDWPDSSRIAVWVILYLEYYELHPPDDAIQDPRFRGEFGNFHPDYRTYSRREYGNRIGIFRILESLAQFGVRATVAANTLAIQERRILAETCHAAGHELCAHGIAATRLVSSEYSYSDEHKMIEEAQVAIAQITGERPRGWIAQDFGESVRTPQQLAASGFSWLGHWPNDDQPYAMTTDPPLISIPYHNEWDDANVIEARKIPVWKWVEIATAAFHQLYSEGGRVFGLGLHPWVIGHPHRISYLNRLLAHITQKKNVWIASGTEIDSAFRHWMNEQAC